MPNIAVGKENVRRQTASLGTLNGGLWLDLPPSDAPKSGWTGGYNFTVGADYLVRPVLGRALLADLTTDENLKDSLPNDLTIYGIGEHTTAEGAPQMYVFIGDQIAVTDGSGWAWVDLSLVTNGPGGAIVGYTIEEPGYWLFTMMGEVNAVGTIDEYLICTCPGNKILYFSNTGAAFIADTTKFYATSVKPAWSLVYKGRLWIGGDPLYPDSLFASVSAQPSEWGDIEEDGEITAASAQENIIGNRDGDPIVAGIVKFGKLFIIKSRSVWYLDASEPDPINWYADKFNAIGGVEACRFTIQDVGADVLYLSHSGNVRSLVDTERAGMYDTSSISAGQVRSWLKIMNTATAASCVDTANGWYLLALPPTSNAEHSTFAIYDYAKKTQDSPGLWYRVAPIWKNMVTVEYDPGPPVVPEVKSMLAMNTRSCFGRSTIFATTSNEAVLSGDYRGRIYREFQTTTEALWDNTTGDVVAWLTGVHINKEDYTNMHILNVAGLFRFGGAPADIDVKLGVVVNPATNSTAVAHRIALDASYSSAAVWGTSLWGTMVWGAEPNVEAEANVGMRGRSFALYLYAKNAPISVARMFVSFEEGRV